MMALSPTRHSWEQELITTAGWVSSQLVTTASGLMARKMTPRLAGQHLLNLAQEVRQMTQAMLRDQRRRKYPQGHHTQQRPYVRGRQSTIGQSWEIPHTRDYPLPHPQHRRRLYTPQPLGMRESTQARRRVQQPPIRQQARPMYSTRQHFQPPARPRLILRNCSRSRNRPEGCFRRPAMGMGEEQTRDLMEELPLPPRSTTPTPPRRSHREPSPLPPPFPENTHAHRHCHHEQEDSYGQPRRRTATCPPQAMTREAREENSWEEFSGESLMSEEHQEWLAGPRRPPTREHVSPRTTSPTPSTQGRHHMNQEQEQEQTLDWGEPTQGPGTDTAPPPHVKSRS